MPETRKMQRPVSPTATKDADDQPRGNCYGTDDPDLFFSNHPDDQAAARRICQACPLKDDCAAGAIKHEEVWGIWGDTTEEERVKVIKRNAARSPEMCKNRLHIRTEQNTRVRPDGHRICRPCLADADREYRARKNALARARAAAAKEMSA